MSLEKDRHLFEHQGLSEWRVQSAQRRLYDSRLLGQRSLAGWKDGGGWT